MNAIVNSARIVRAQVPQYDKARAIFKKSEANFDDLLKKLQHNEMEKIQKVVGFVEPLIAPAPSNCEDNIDPQEKVDALISGLKTQLGGIGHSVSQTTESNIKLADEE